MVAPFQGDKSIVSAANFFLFRSGYPDEVAAPVKEAVFTRKERVVVVYQGATFGPAMMQLTQEVGKKEGLNVVAYVKLDTAVQDKLAAVIKDVVAAVVKASPDAVILLLGGRPAPELVKQIRNSPAQNAQLYLMSIVTPGDVVKVAGDAVARGIVIAQSAPFPFSPTLPLVDEYQKMMKQYAPDEPLSFSTLEGFVAGKITVEALKRAGPRPTREKVLRTLHTKGELDPGGVYVNYTSKARNGWGKVDLTVIGPNGKLLRWRFVVAEITARRAFSRVEAQAPRSPARRSARTRGNQRASRSRRRVRLPRPAGARARHQEKWHRRSGIFLFAQAAGIELPMMPIRFPER